MVEFECNLDGIMVVICIGLLFFGVNYWEGIIMGLMQIVWMEIFIMFEVIWGVLILIILGLLFNMIDIDGILVVLLMNLFVKGVGFSLDLVRVSWLLGVLFGVVILFVLIFM